MNLQKVRDNFSTECKVLSEDSLKSLHASLPSVMCMREMYYSDSIRRVRCRKTCKELRKPWRSSSSMGLGCEVWRREKPSHCNSPVISPTASLQESASRQIKRRLQHKLRELFEEGASPGHDHTLFFVSHDMFFGETAEHASGVCTVSACRMGPLVKNALLARHASPPNSASLHLHLQPVVPTLQPVKDSPSGIPSRPTGLHEHPGPGRVRLGGRGGRRGSTSRRVPGMT